MNRRLLSGWLLCVATLSVATAYAQVDLSGEWAVRFHEDQVERIEGPEIGDYLGLPINDAARLRGDSWDASLHTLPEWQCRPHPSDYGSRGPASLRFWKEVDTATQQLIAYHVHVQWQAQERTIWMDGRPHPSEDAMHTWQGFSTGKWEGNMLTVVTTHLKESYLRRNGAPRSDRALHVEHWFRHGNVLTLVSVVEDPVYLTEPLVRTTNWEFDKEQSLDPYPCEVAEEIDRPEGKIPHHLPGANPFLKELSEKLKIPEAAPRGGKKTAYPEYIAELRSGNATVDNDPRTAPLITQAITQLPQGEIHVQRVRGNVYMLYGAGGNITVSAGDDGAFLVDGGLANMTDKVLAEVKKLSPKPIRFIVNTHIHPDHTGGNAKLMAAGETIAGGDVAMLNSDVREGAYVIAHQNVLNRMVNPGGNQPGAPFAQLPKDTYFGKRKNMFFNDEAVQLFHPANAHTDGDTFVFFRRSDVIATGDIFSMNGYPFIDSANGGTINGIIAALNQILELAIPKEKSEGGTLIVPGHGRLCDSADVAYYRDMVTIIRDRVQDMKQRGMTIDQVKAAKPTFDYDPRWGAATGFNTTDNFVEAVYKTLP
jgi:glyoxylase-like metal-dependent hydrolase (beta-lactamase superfamily II)